MLFRSTFWDAGMIVQPVKINVIDVKAQMAQDAELFSDYFSGEKDSLHSSIGGGLHFALNENFIVAVDMGKALNPQDGNIGFYIGLNYLF